MNQTTLQAQTPRYALMKVLDGLLGKQVIYVHAPAGFGKTMSALLWLEHREKQARLNHSWISLDEHDNKTAEFCKRFTAALVTMHPENVALRELSVHPVFGTAPVEFILHALGVCDSSCAPCILVLDDLHVLKNEEILNLLPILFKRLPGSCTVLLLSRHSPPDSFSEIVAKGEVAVVDTEQLKFSSEEIRAFFTRNGRNITGRQAERIYTSTGGWAIGIRALLLSEEKAYSVNLTGKYLENFLKTHVWERWDEDLKRFMTHVSVVHELTPTLCEWLVADDKSLKNISSLEMLSDLARENAFLRETGPGKFRFHDLFRDFLLAMLKEQGPKVATAQWNRAGDYYLEQNDCFRAAEYYLQAHNDDGVAQALYFMYDYNSPYASVEDTLYTIRTSVNEALIESHPFLLEVLIWAAYVEGRPEDFERLLDDYHKLLAKIILSNPRSLIINNLLHILDYRVGFIEFVKSFKKIPFKGNIKAYSPSLTNNLPHFHRSIRDFSELATDLTKNMTVMDKSGIGAILDIEWPVVRHCLLAGIHYERGKSHEACEEALAAMAHIRDGCSVEAKFCAMMILVSALLANDDAAEANKVLSAVGEMIDDDKAFFLKPNLRAFLCRLKLMDGDKDAANTWFRDVKGSIYENPSLYKSYQHVTSARSYIVIGDYSHAILLLKKLLTLFEAYERPLDIIETKILLAIAYWRKGKSGNFTALEYMEAAIVLAHKYEYTQSFATDGADLVNMLHRLQKKAVQSEHNIGVPSAFFRSLYIEAVATSKKQKGMTGGHAPLNLTFTDKQKMVMALMCEGLSRNEIAGRMDLKPNSVKTHVELIYRKLDVSSNIDAVLKIKELGVLN